MYVCIYVGMYVYIYIYIYIYLCICIYWVGFPTSRAVPPLCADARHAGWTQRMDPDVKGGSGLRSYNICFTISYTIQYTQHSYYSTINVISTLNNSFIS